VRDVHRERGLADAAASADRDDRHRAVRLRTPGERAGDLGDLLGATGEVGDVGRQRRGPGEGNRLSGRARGDVVGEDRLLDPAQVGPGLQAQLADHRVARVLVGVERLRAAAGAVQGAYQLAAEAFAEGMCRDEGDHLGDEVAGAVEGQVGVDPLLDRGQPPFFQARRLRGEAGQPAEGGPPPQAERGAQLLRGTRRVQAARGLQTALELQKVDLVGAQHVAGRDGHDDVAYGLAARVGDPPGPAQCGDAGLDLRGGGRGRAFAPHGLDQPVDAADAAGVE
jgi:hypothetical protein